MAHYHLRRDSGKEFSDLGIEGDGSSLQSDSIRENCDELDVDKTGNDIICNNLEFSKFEISNSKLIVDSEEQLSASDEDGVVVDG